MAGRASKAARRLAVDLRNAPAQLLAVAAGAVQQGIETQLQRDIGGDQALSGMKNSRLIVKVDERGDSTTISAAGSLGAWGIIEGGSKAHDVKARKGRRSRALKVAGDWRTGPVHVRGSRPKHTFTRGVEAGTSRAVDLMAAEWARINGA
jgi:hypothetical protein